VDRELTHGADDATWAGGAFAARGNAHGSARGHQADDAAARDGGRGADGGPDAVGAAGWQRRLAAGARGDGAAARRAARHRGAAREQRYYEPFIAVFLLWALG
jgi:hypothetical protein